MNNLTHLSLCSGIGGLDLAAEWAGVTTVAQCEIDVYASKVLAKNFKGVPNLNDIRTVTNGRLREYGINPAALTVISAGFPCQPYSLAGKGLGDSDSRDLWGEVARVLGEVQPRWFVGENTPGLFSRENQRYFRRILNDLAALGYSVGWGIWGAVDVGAPHKRDRVFIVAHANGKRRDIHEQNGRTTCKTVGEPKTETPFGASRFYGNIPDADSGRQQKRRLQRQSSIQSSQICSALSDAASDELGLFGSKEEIARTASCGRDNRHGVQTNVGGEWWQVEPDVGRVANGVSARVDRLRCLGNAVVPAQAYPIFEMIAEMENAIYLRRK